MTQYFPAAAIREFRSRLLGWFAIHRRDLPWRRSSDPYAIWVSEIMLQQTRVAAVLDHYAVWMRRFPDVEALAAASEDEVLAAWSGLGYYRRARFLHRGAKVVVAEYAGQLPSTAEELRKLPGIGAYTSAAIASIAFAEAVAVVDGNVERVLLRQTGSGESLAGGAAALSAAEMQALASKLVDPAHPGDCNQAMMELGATVCLPRRPLCLQCPVQKSCQTRGEHPTAARKAAISVEVACGLLRRRAKRGDEVLLQQRAADSTVMPGMWELPGLPVAGVAGHLPEALFVVRHAIMQTNYRVSVVEVAAESMLETAAERRRWIVASQLSGLGLTGLTRKILMRLGLLELTAT